MEKIAFKMKLLPGFKAEYKKRHEEIWEDLVDLLKNNGVSDYSIFFDEESNTLFGVQKISGTNSSQDLGSNAIVQRWWKYMSDIMYTNPDYSPIITPLEKLFEIE
ncbi:L-rhamnose mutarotase [Pedobacter africanus]|uniref:L-rhamnose mutarotase n=1 Tax=Pedobacter africanus TaxID=151894 RepID=A0A1W1Z8F0_9SPHI|nr:L-rhamnose mutarotase [Pedobacter africanus]SMC44695.1 L-rhamnose mutarotase [Pedobacter africanus]